MSMDPTAPPTYNSMQQQVGLLPFQPPPMVFPGQVSAALAQGGTGAAFMTLGAPQGGFGAQQYQTYTNQSPMLQGPTGIMMPMQASAPMSPYAGMNPYAGLSAMGPYSGAPGLYTPMAPLPPPAYAGARGGMPFAGQTAAAFAPAYQMGLEQQQAAADINYGRGFGAMGAASRGFADMGAAAMGAMAGGRFGKWGAFAGAAGGFAASEMSGFGQGAQNGFMNYVASPFLQQRGVTAGLEEMSRGWGISGGAMHLSGSGFSHHAAAEMAGGLRSMANSSDFRNETGNRFNYQDMLRITQSSSQNDMMTGVQNSMQGTQRIREIAKSLSSFMELAQEPDIQRAIQTMGSLRASGLNLNETMQAVANGRSFARMSGQTFAELAQTSGAMGSQTFQSMGLSQGLGFQAGMMHGGIARGSQAGGTLSPQLLSLVGGSQGLANMNNMFSGSLLQQPMFAPGMMSASGGLSQGAVGNLLSGNANLFGMTSRGSGVLQGMTGRYGVEGLGTALAMQPMLQDQLGRIMQSQGPFAQRNIEDQQVMGLMRQMGMRGSSGFMTAAQAMGMDRTQALSRAMEASSPGHFERQREQIETSRREGRTSELAERARSAPGFLDTFGRESGATAAYGDVRMGMENINTAVSHALSGQHRFDGPTSDAERRRIRETTRSSAFVRSLNNDRIGYRSPGVFESMSDAYTLSQARGGSGIIAGIEGAMNAFRTPENVRENQLRSLGEGGRLAGALISTTDQERYAAARRMGDTFGTGTAGSRAQQAFAADMTRMGGEFARGSRPRSETSGAIGNAALRLLGLGASEGMVDVGNSFGQGGMRQSAVRDAFIRRMTESGMSREEAARRFDANSTTIMQQVSSSVMDSMTPEQRQRMQAATEFAGEGAGRGDFMKRAQRMQQSAVEDILGHGASHDSTQAFMRRYEGVEGIGNNEAQRKRSRSIIMAHAQTSAVIGVGGTRGRQAAQRLRDIRMRAREEGFSDEQIEQMVSSSRGITSSMSDEEKTTAQRYFEQNRHGGARSMFDNLDVSSERFRRGQSRENAAAGFGALATGGGAMSEVLRGYDASTFSTANIADRLRSMDSSQLGRLRTENRAMYDAVSRFRANPNDENAMGAVLGAAGQLGTRRREVERDYDNSRGFLDRLADRINPTRRERHIVQRMTRQTAADARADTQTANVNATEGQASSAGLGSASDALQEAARDLRQVSENFRSATQGSGLATILSR